MADEHVSVPTPAAPPPAGEGIQPSPTSAPTALPAPEVAPRKPRRHGWWGWLWGDKPDKSDTPGYVPQSDAFREVVETIVFVVVLVLLLKSFAAEAFVIPTGSMAETLWGYQKVVTCPSCRYQFPVNCSNEVDPQSGPRELITGCKIGRAHV